MFRHFIKKKILALQNIYMSNRSSTTCIRIQMGYNCDGVVEPCKIHKCSMAQGRFPPVIY